jgi:hypothetical protein
MTKFKTLLSVLTIALLAGCASFNANTYNAEKLAVDTATTATHGFNQYYQSATNGASAADLAKLNSARDQIYTVDRDLSASLAVLDQARLQYVANAADTNKTAVLAAMQTVSQESSNLVSLVKTFLPPPNPAKK